MRLIYLLSLFLLSCGPREESDIFSLYSSPTFPYSHVADEDYASGSTSFGAERDGGRLHAGCDLIGPAGEPVYAVENGTVLDFYEFYSGTYALEVKHDSFIIRYGEVSRMEPGVVIGGRIRQGQIIARVGLLYSGNSMLHFEMYSGNATGRLTNRDSWPYQRRGDLMNPTQHLQSWPYPR